MNEIRARRTAAELSQVELALRAGIQPGSLCRYERGVNPSKRNAERIASALGCDVHAVFPNFSSLRDY